MNKIDDVSIYNAPSQDAMRPAERVRPVGCRAHLFALERHVLCKQQCSIKNHKVNAL